MEKLYPNKNYTISAAIRQHRPAVPSAAVRLVQLESAESEMQRRALFSFAVMDMLQISAQTKIMLLQVRRRPKLELNDCYIFCNVPSMQCFYIHKCAYIST